MNSKDVFSLFMKGFGLLAVSFCSFAAQAQTADCVSIANGAIREVSIQPSSGFLNCFYIDIPAGSSSGHIVAQSYNRSAFSVRELTVGGDGQLKLDAETYSDTAATLTKALSRQGRIYFSIRPSSGDRLPKNIAVFAGLNEGVEVIHFGIQDVVAGSVSLPPEDPCTDPRRHCSKLSPLGPARLQTLASCSASTSPPADKNPQFDINANLEQFKNARAAVDRLPAGARDFTRAMIMTSMFYTGRRYDLKSSANPSMRSGEKFGNWFYGAAAAEMGYTQQQAVTAGAVVQQVQNYTYPDHPAYRDAVAMAAGILYAARTGLGDNPGDADLIRGGFDYASKVFDADPSRNAVANSCDRTPPVRMGGGDVGGASGVSVGAGWRGGSISPTPGCYGNCGGGGSVRVGPIIPLQNGS